MAKAPDIPTIADDPRQDALFAPPPAVKADFDPGDFSDEADPDNPFRFAFPQGTATPDSTVRTSVAIAFATRSLGLSDFVEKAVLGQAMLAARVRR
jgi:cell division protein FtsI/penicillin-binding protein 2